MTERLYYTDAYLRDFHARIVARELWDAASPDAKGNRRIAVEAGCLGHGHLEMLPEREASAGYEESSAVSSTLGSARPAR